MSYSLFDSYNYKNCDSTSEMNDEHPRVQRENKLLARRVTELLASWISQLIGPMPLRREEMLNYTITLKDEITFLEQERCKSYSQENFQKSVVARARRQLYLWLNFPINELPAELLAHVFHFVVIAPIDRTLTANRLKLSGVCRRWRNVFICTPLLWSSIFIHDHPPYRFSSISLDRAGWVPLEVGIDMRDNFWDGNEQKHSIIPSHMSILMNILTPRVPQIRKLSLLTDTWAPMIVVLNRLQSGPVPVLLERLELHRTGSPYVALSGIPRQLLVPARLFRGHMPSLRYLRLDGVHLNWQLSSLRKLRVLEMRRMAMEVMPSVKVFREILINSPEVHTLIFQAAGPRWVKQELSTWSKLSLRSLHTLYLGDFVAGYAEFITALFESPFLRRLSLDTLDGGDYTPLLRLMTNAFPMLTVLTIRHLEMSDTKETEDVIWEWLCSMPKLKFLKISRVTDRFFGALLRHPQLMSGCIGGGTDMQPVCPVLKDVEFVDNNFQMASRLLDSRRELGVPLRHVFVSTDNATSGELEHYQNLPGLVVSRAHAHMRRDLELQYLYD